MSQPGDNQSIETRRVTLKINGVEYTVPAQWSLISEPAVELM